MTETQATSGAAGTSANPAGNATDGSSPGGGAAVGRATVPANDSADSTTPASGGSGPASGGSGPASGGSAPASGGSAPAGPNPGLPGGLAGSGAPVASGGARYTRAPGMPPPPDAPPAGDDDSGGDRRRAAVAAAAAATAGISAAPTGVSAAANVPVVPGAMTVTPPVGTAHQTGAARPVTIGRTGFGAFPAGRPIGAARVADAVRAARATSSAAAARGPRRARLTVRRVDPWSVMKFSFAVSLVLFIVTIVATSVLYLALDTMDVFTSVNASLSDLLSQADAAEGETFKITAQGVIGTAALLGAVNVVLVTALATLGAFIYNVCADMVGGVEVTLSERE